MGFPPLAPGTHAYRVVRLKHFDRADNTVKMGEVLRRLPDQHGNPRDVNGLSVNYNCEPEAAAPGFDNVAIFRLEVDFVRSIRLDLTPDSENHANIVGLPRPEEDLDRANSLAAKLAMNAEFVVFRPKRR